MGAGRFAAFLKCTFGIGSMPHPNSSTDYIAGARVPAARVLRIIVEMEEEFMKSPMFSAGLLALALVANQSATADDRNDRNDRDDNK